MIVIEVLLEFVNFISIFIIKLMNMVLKVIRKKYFLNIFCEVDF